MLEQEHGDTPSSTQAQRRCKQQHALTLRTQWWLTRGGLISFGSSSSGCGYRRPARTGPGLVQAGRGAGSGHTWPGACRVLLQGGAGAEGPWGEQPLRPCALFHQQSPGQLSAERDKLSERGAIVLAGGIVPSPFTPSGCSAGHPVLLALPGASWHAGGVPQSPTPPLVPCPTAGWDDGGGRPQAPEEKLPNANGWRPTGRLKAALITRRGCPQTIPSPAQREDDASLLLIAISVHACVHALSSKHSCGGKELLIQMHFCLFVVRLSLLCCCCLLAWHLHALDQATALLTSRGVLLWVLLAVGAQGLSRFTCLAQPHGLNPCQEKWKNLVQPGLEKTARTVCD